MPRLLRLHFSSIGHRDARLSPLTLDFRHAGPAADGTGADSLLWLRNGGGKSSIINLFYALFRTHAREFLGSSAEGKARRIDDYVKADDLAFVVSEWDVDPDAAPTLFSEEPAERRVVGQVLAWRGRQRSTDLSRLRRLFFSLRVAPGLVTFDDLPIHGLGAPSASFAAFRDWLRDSHQDRASLEITYTESHQTWQRHLERLGLDPEIYRYQLKMNRREGAADEAFRFGATQDFVEFMLEMAFESAAADQLARNLEAQRDSLRQRPRFDAEHEFISAALEQLRPLVEALRSLAAARRELSAVLDRAAAVLGGIDGQVRRLEREREAARAAAEDAAAGALAAQNERDKKLRWSRGCERMALQFDEEKGRLSLQEARELRETFDQELREARAAIHLRRERRLAAELEQLQEALRRAALDVEPLRLEAARHGAALRELLLGEQERLDQVLHEARRMAARAADDAASARAEGEATSRRAAALEEELRHLERRMDERDRARRVLIEGAVVQRREPAVDAAARWRAREVDLDSQVQEAEEARAAAEERLDAVRDRAVGVRDTLARQQTQIEALEQQWDEALAWRDRLSCDPALLEVEAVDEANLEAPGLEQRLRHQARVARREALESQVQGAEDRRSLEAIEQEGLLPSPPDVERVVARLRDDEINAHAGPAYVADNLPEPERLELILSDPARYGGVVVVDPAGLERARQISVEHLRTPVQVSCAGELEPPAPPAAALVLAPDPGLYDHRAAQERRIGLETSISRRTERSEALQAREGRFIDRAAELCRFLDSHGRGRLDALGQRLADARELAAAADREIAELDHRADALRGERARLTTLITDLDCKLDDARQARLRVEQFVQTHERALEGIRARRIAAARERRDAERSAEQALELEQRARELRERMSDRARDQQARRDQAAAEREAVTLFDGDGAPTALSLEQARAAYDTTRRQYERELSESKLQWQIEAKQEEARATRAALRKAAAALDRAALERWLERGDLEAEIGRVEHDLRDQIRVVGQAEERLQLAARALEAHPVQRDDRPGDRPAPGDAAAARATARELTAEAEEHVLTLRQAEEARDHHERLSGSAGHEAREQRTLAGTLRTVVVDSSGIDLPAAAPATVPVTAAELAPLMEQLRGEFLQRRDRVDRAARKARAGAEATQRVASASRFGPVAAQHKERMKATTEALFEEAPALTEGLETRLVVIERQLAQYDEDRRVLVDELLQLADQVSTLLRRAGHASTLPAGLAGWSGRPYLRINFSFPSTDEERRARLEPLVDRLVQGATLPGGQRLVNLTAQELAGSRGFDVKILKPDTVLRPEPISITALSTFSRGQQLTAAILLYCTLVQLRARSRGRGRGAQDAGVLILDNPIGTCSSVSLLSLQRRIATQMRVQLIYATGVEDLEALEVLPNKIRLRNTHRDRASGDYHVTAEAEGQVEAVRVVQTLEPS